MALTEKGTLDTFALLEYLLSAEKQYPHLIIDPDTGITKKFLNATDLAIAVCLAKTRNSAHAGCFPSIKTLAAMSLSSESSVKRSIKALQHAGIIRIYKNKYDSNSKYENNNYFFMFEFEDLLELYQDTSSVFYQELNTSEIFEQCFRKELIARGIG